MSLPTDHVVSDPNHVPDHNALAAQVNQNTTDIAGAERTSNKGVPLGYAGLDSAGYVEGLIPTPFTAGAGASLTGATAAARFAGGTSTGPPTSGTFVRGDFVIAQDGLIWICTANGTPGTWHVSFTAGTSGIQSYATAAARDTAVPTPIDGTVVYLQDVDQFLGRVAGSWVPIGVDSSAAAWTAYTPTWTTTGVAIGNGTLLGRYSKLGRTVHAHLTLVAGSTTNFGSTAWAFTLPFAAATLPGLGRYVGSAYYRDASGAGVYVGSAQVDETNGRVYCYFQSTTFTFSTWAALLSTTPTTAATAVSSTVPFTWASGDALSLSLTYESTG